MKYFILFSARSHEDNEKKEGNLFVLLATVLKPLPIKLPTSRSYEGTSPQSLLSSTYRHGPLCILQTLIKLLLLGREWRTLNEDKRE